MQIEHATTGEMVTQVHTEKVPRWELEVFYDEGAESPREAFSNLGTFLTWDRGYRSPDDNVWDNPQGFYDWWTGAKDDDGEYLSSLYTTDGEGLTEEPVPAGGGVLLDVFKIDHSGIAYRAVPHGAGDPFGSYYMGMDSGQVGFIYITAEEIALNWGGGYFKSPEDQVIDATRILTGEVEEYSRWASGGCWGFTITDNETGDSESLGGYYCDLTRDELCTGINDLLDVPADVLHDLLNGVNL